VARIQEQRQVSEEKFKARMKQHEIEAEESAAEDRKLTEAIARQMSYAKWRRLMCKSARLGSTRSAFSV